MKENKVQQISHKLINIVVFVAIVEYAYCLLYTSDAADDAPRV